MSIVTARYIGFCCTLMGVGFARMAFTPLTATAVYEGLVLESTTSLVGALLMLTYAIGACCSGGLLRRIGTVKLIKMSLMIALTCQLFELLAPSLELWLMTRGCYGFAGGCLMVAGPAIAVSVGSQEQLGRTPLWTFVGVGAGAFIAASLLQLPISLSILQNLLLIIAFFVVSSVWFLFSKAPNYEVLLVKNDDNNYRTPWPIIVLLTAYTLDALGYVPATVYLCDFAANQLNMGRDVGNSLWQSFGLGAVLSMPLMSLLDLRRHARITIVVIYLLKTSALFVMFFTEDYIYLSISAFLTGLSVPSIVLLTAILLRQWVAPSEFPLLWQKATAFFAIGQAVSALVMAGVFNFIIDYQPLFLSGALLMGGAALLVSSLIFFPHQINMLRSET